MDLENPIIRKGYESRLAETLQLMASHNGQEFLKQAMLSLIQRRSSRAAVARRFGFFVATDPEHLKAMRRLYELADALPTWSSTDHQDLSDDMRNFMMLSYWMRLEDAGILINPLAVHGAATRHFVPASVWPHALLKLTLLIESHLLEEFVRRDGLAKEVCEESLCEFTGLCILMAAFAALKMDLGKAGGGYARWEGILFLCNGRFHEEGGCKEHFGALGATVREMELCGIITARQLTIAGHYRAAFQTLAYGLARTPAVKTALFKSVYALRGAAAAGYAVDASLSWEASVEKLQEFVSTLGRALPQEMEREAAADRVTEITDADVSRWIDMDGLLTDL